MKTFWKPHFQHCAVHSDFLLDKIRCCLWKLIGKKQCVSKPGETVITSPEDDLCVSVCRVAKTSVSPNVLKVLGFP